jgi:bacterioferritin-associated ferredoxin
MIICQCRVVTDREIRAAISCGAADVCAVAAVCQAGVRCGGCLPAVRDLLAEHGLPTDEHLGPRQIRREVAAVNLVHEVSA